MIGVPCTGRYTGGSADILSTTVKGVTFGPIRDEHKAIRDEHITIRDERTFIRDEWKCVNCTGFLHALHCCALTSVRDEHIHLSQLGNHS